MERWLLNLDYKLIGYDSTNDWTKTICKKCGNNCNEYFDKLISNEYDYADCSCRA